MSYVIVPLFALANAGVDLGGRAARRRRRLADHARHPVGYMVGKPAGILAATWIASRLRLGARRLTISWPASLARRDRVGHRLHRLAADLEIALTGRQLDEAKIGVLAAAIVATLGTAARHAA